MAVFCIVFLFLFLGFIGIFWSVQGAGLPESEMFETEIEVGVSNVRFGSQISPAGC